MNIKTLYQKFIDECDGQISTDTRNIIPGSLFFAWKGDNADGNTYAEEALKLGCSYVVIDNPKYNLNEKCLLVNDSLQTFQELAHHHRKQFDIPVIALTGSNGKTTTKELTASVLGTKRDVVATEGNLNNHVGVPLTLFKIKKTTEIAIIEMGANHFGEIAKLCEIAAPTYGVITNIGRAHLGLFGGFDGVVRAKTELYRYLEKTAGTTFVNGLDSLLLEKANTAEKITYLSTDSDYPMTSLETRPFVSLTWKEKTINTQLTGEYNIQNISVAICIGDYFGISHNDIISGIKGYQPSNERSEIVETEKGNLIIKDYYNANRSSIECALENLDSIKTNKDKIVILGDMFELGEYEDEEHDAIVKKALVYNFKKIVLVGKAFSRVELTGNDAQQYETTEEAISALQKSGIKNSAILLKASNGMNFKKLFNGVDW